MEGNQKGNQFPMSHETSPPTAAMEEDIRKWGTHEMGAPASPATHPDNQHAARWQAYDDHKPYFVYSPVEKPADSPYEYLVNSFNLWSHRAEDMARNVWQHLKTGPSVSGAAWGKVNLTAKAISEGGFEPLFKQIFSGGPDERLKKTFACYLSTTTGPVAGTLYLSSIRLAFCSDRPLTFRAPSGQDSWTYYKVAIPIENIRTVNPVVTKESSPEKYIQITTVDGHEFWFMGFLSFDKASHVLDTATGRNTTVSMATGTTPPNSVPGGNTEPSAVSGNSAGRA